MVLLSFCIATTIRDESGLSFLGLGAAVVGTTLASAKSYMFDDPWYTAIAGVALSAAIIALNLGRVRKPRSV
jgi:ABC-type dipeptide/oligopeptide/nickel transport system permease subunit